MYENNNYSVTSDELKLKLDSKDPFMLILEILNNLSKIIFLVHLMLCAMRNQKRI